MPRYVWRDGHWVERSSGERLIAEGHQWQPVAPMAVIGDIPAYQSPVTGETISGRAAKRDDLKRHGCVDARELPSPTGGKVRKRSTIEKYNLPEMMLKGSE